MPWDFKKRVKELDKIFGIQIQNEELLKKSLTHGSFIHENELNNFESYERLEFFGDAVLKLCVSEILYKKFPNYAEGELTKIRSIVVSDATLAKVAEKIGLAKLILLGKKEEKMGGRERKSILACVFEAVLAVYYFEGKYSDILNFLEKVLMPFIEETDENFEKFNAKAVLQEYTQSQNKETPKYLVVEEVGPEHDKIFVVEVSYQDEVLALGKGKTKKEAEQVCAYQACVKLGVIR